MLIRELTLNEKEAYDRHAQHLIQSWAWGETKEKLGKETHRYGIFNDFGELIGSYQISIHPLPAPLATWRIGYLAKGPLPTKEIIEALIQFGIRHNIIFFKLEPDVGFDLSDTNSSSELSETKKYLSSLSTSLVPSQWTLFTEFNFILDLTKSDEQLKTDMHPKTRYNINVAQKKGVQISVHTDDQAFETFCLRYFETCQRNGFYGHDRKYHQTVWQTLRQYDMARILIASYNNVPLTTWMLFNFHDTLYYPYGGSTTQYREVMASNLVAWEAIQLGKQLGCHRFDLWGALGPQADTNDSFYGFHKFKSGYNPTHYQYVGTYDLIINHAYYQLFLKLQNLRTQWMTHYAQWRKQLPFLK